MDKLKSRLSKSPEDRAVQNHVAEAQRHIYLAMKICAELRKTRGLKSRRASSALSVLDKAARILSGVIRTTPLYDLADPDLLPASARIVRPASDGDKKK